MKLQRPKAVTTQEVVNRVFRECMAADQRTLDEIRAAVRAELKLTDEATTLWGWQPSNHELQIMISRNCMGEGEWDYFPAYSNPPRYISKHRLMYLLDRAEKKRLMPSEQQVLRDYQADLSRAKAHWIAKHKQAKAKERELETLIVDVSTRAYAGHYEELL